MALKKSDLYSSLWASCDELRGGMDASQYKDYVLVFLFLKYISDKYAGQPFAPLTIPAGSSFADMVALKGSKDIGDDINKKIIAPLVEANDQLAQSDFPDFNDPNKLGSGKEMVGRLTNLIAIFEDPALDFSANRADGDDILGDAYEYLMRHFATESGKSKGQFYTPAEVSRIMAQVIGIGSADNITARTTAYDPTCGSGSLLLKVADEALPAKITLEGQEKDSTTSGLARMNMILHDYPTADIQQGNTLSNPRFTATDGSLKTYDYVVANPPFSDKAWSTGLDTEHDPYGRFTGYGIPPGKQGDYAYLLHILRSLKSTGKGACILPHGVLFRGNAEAAIRRNLIQKGFLKGIIGLPANLFYGTGIPACILVLDKENAVARKGIFMIDASKGFMKDGNKNRLRSRDIHKIVDVFTHGEEHPGYSRLVPLEEIADPKNDYNLNLPRYLDTREAEDIQDIDAHLHGGIPTRDLDALDAYWQVCPELKESLFTPLRPGYLQLSDDFPLSTLNSQLKEHPQFAAFLAGMEEHFTQWRDRTATELKSLQPGCNPKEIIHQHSESLLAHYENHPQLASLQSPLIDPYAVYQHLMDYWAMTLQDDCYLISADGWEAETTRLVERNKKTGKERDKGWTCELIPKELVVARYFAAEQAAIETQQAELETLAAQLTELEEEHSGEDGAFSELEKITNATVTARLKEHGSAGILPASTTDDEVAILKRWQKLTKASSALKKAIKAAEAALDQLAHDQYPQLSEDEIKTLVVEDKWLATLATAIHGELDRISQALTQRVKELADRYNTPLPALTARVTELEEKVHAHLERMGFQL